jgi:hypothetical protein
MNIPDSLMLQEALRHPSFKRPPEFLFEANKIITPPTTQNHNVSPSGHYALSL